MKVRAATVPMRYNKPVLRAFYICSPRQVFSDASRTNSRARRRTSRTFFHSLFLRPPPIPTLLHLSYQLSVKTLQNKTFEINAESSQTVRIRWNLPDHHLPTSPPPTRVAHGLTNAARDLTLRSFSFSAFPNNPTTPQRNNATRKRCSRSHR
jgi:hypothetical protein